jgi:hypothetical protein
MPALSLSYHPDWDTGFDALQNVFIALQKLANRTKKKQLKSASKP